MKQKKIPKSVPNKEDPPSKVIDKKLEDKDWSIEDSLKIIKNDYEKTLETWMIEPLIEKYAEWIEILGANKFIELSRRMGRKHVPDYEDLKSKMKTGYILGLLSQGKNTSEVGKIMNMSKDAVKKRRKEFYRQYNEGEIKL